jgi:hypothetical protein
MLIKSFTRGNCFFKNFILNKNYIVVTIVTKEFKEEAKPLIEEEMRIRNWGMTNTQRLVAMAFKDIQPRATKIFQVHSIFNMVLKQQSEMIKQYKMQNQQQENATRPIIINDIQEPDERS